MTDYVDLYKRRLNRFGHTHQSRVQGQREQEFELYLKKSVYRVAFIYNKEGQVGTLEPYKEDETETLAYLLTRVDLNIPEGTILFLPNKDNIPVPWMVWWLETMRASGYNRYVMLRMTQRIGPWWGYIKGPKKSPIEDTVRSRYAKVLYTEDENLYLFITPFTPDIKKEDYFDVNFRGRTQSFVVTGVDMLSTPGILYVSIDPVYKRDQSDPPEQTPADSDADFYWLNGGDTNGSP